MLTHFVHLHSHLGFPGGAVVKNPPANAGVARDADSLSGSGRSPGVGNGNLLQYSCLRNPRDRGAWWARVQGVATQGQSRGPPGAITWAPRGNHVSPQGKSRGPPGAITDAGKDWGQEEKGTTEDEMVGWHH